MEVLLLKDVPTIGLAGQIKKVSDGYAKNFLIPKKFAVEATEGDVTSFKAKVGKQVVEEHLAGSRVAQLAEQLKSLHLTLKEKANEQGKLYGAVGPDEIVELLKAKGVSVDRKQVEFTKAIRTTGEYKIVIRLTSKLKPEVLLKVVAA